MPLITGSKIVDEGFVYSQGENVAKEWPHVLVWKGHWAFMNGSRVVVVNEHGQWKEAPYATISAIKVHLGDAPMSELHGQHAINFINEQYANVLYKKMEKSAE